MDKGMVIAIFAVLVATVAVIIAMMGLQAQPAAISEPQPTPAPTPEPAIGIAVEGDMPGFAEAIKEGLSDGYELSEENGDITLMYMPEPVEVGRREGETVILTDKSHIIVDGISGVLLSEEGATQAAWDALYNYPTHSTPIRLLTLVRDEQSAAHGIYQDMLGQGKLQDKGLYVAAAAELGPEEWTAKALEGIPVGLLDTIFAQDEELAIAACKALRAAERNDSVEVICAELSEELVQMMAEDHWTMGAAVGYSMDDAVEAMIGLAEDMVEGEQENTLAVAPRTVYSSEVKALFDDGMTDAGEIMAALLKQK